MYWKEVIEKFARDQYGSRFIQQQLESTSEEDKHSVFLQIQQRTLQLCKDVFGNYVLQKFLEHVTQDRKIQLAKTIINKVKHLTKSMYGRVVQKTFECVSDGLKITSISELRGHVEECVRDQNGNHAIQKCIEVPKKDIQFIVDTLQNKVFQYRTLFTWTTITIIKRNINKYNTR